MKFACLVTLMLVLTGCGAACETSTDFAKGKDLQRAITWLDAKVFNEPLSRKNLAGQNFVSYGSHALKREYWKSLRVTSEAVRQVTLVGDYRNPDGVFLSMGSYVGVLISRKGVAPLIAISRLGLPVDNVKVVRGRAAVICSQPHL